MQYSELDMLCGDTAVRAQQENFTRTLYYCQFSDVLTVIN